MKTFEIYFTIKGKTTLLADSKEDAENRFNDSTIATLSPDMDEPEIDDLFEVPE